MKGMMKVFYENYNVKTTNKYINFRLKFILMIDMVNKVINIFCKMFLFHSSKVQIYNETRKAR